MSKNEQITPVEAPETKVTDPKRAERRANQKAAREYLRKMVNAEWPTEPKAVEQALSGVISACRLLFPAKTRREGSGAVTGMGAVLRKLFAAKGSIDELELFKETRMGRNEMRKRTRELIRKSAPEARLWITFDENSECWVLKGEGPDAPADWNGVTPTSATPEQK